MPYCSVLSLLAIIVQSSCSQNLNDRIDHYIKPYVDANEGGYSELIPVEENQFFNRVLYSTIRFIENNDKMIWINNDGDRFEGRAIRE